MELIEGEYLQDMFPAMLDIFKAYLAEEIEFIDSDEMVVRFASLILRIDSLNKKGVMLYALGEEHNIKYITNGKLAIFFEKKLYPVCLKQIEFTCLKPLGLKENIDFTYLLDTHHK